MISITSKAVGKRIYNKKNLRYRHWSDWRSEDIERDFNNSCSQLRLVPATGDKSQIKVNYEPQLLRF